MTYYIELRHRDSLSGWWDISPACVRERPKSDTDAHSAATKQRRRMSADDADPLAGLSLKERELLQYLEDLQRNNPAEYDMIAKQIQEGGANLGDALGNGSKAGKKPPAPKGEMVTPEPGFVAKTHSFTHQARKTFINLCKSDHVDPPAQVEVPGGDLRSK